MNACDALKADVFRKYGCFSWWLFIKGAIFCKTSRALTTMRLCQAIANAPRPISLLLVVFRALHSIATALAGVDIPWKTRVGPGLSLNHGWGLVINQSVQIGNNVTLFHGVTLGRRDRIAKDGKRLVEYPTIEDEVWVGPHAIIVGGITIGRGSRIAGGAFVTENIPSYSVVLGNPAKIVKNNCVPDIMNPAPLPSASA